MRIGNKPNEVPTNADLGRMAFVDVALSDANNITSGTLADERLSANVARTTQLKTINNVTIVGTGNIEVASNVVTDNTNTSRYLTFSANTTGTYQNLFVSANNLYFNPNTGVLSATAFSSLSDVNKKENIRTITNPIDLVQSLRGVRFDWKESGASSIGVIAQELEQIFPELVETSEFGEKTVIYGNIVGLLIEAIKEQQKQINSLLGVE
jgi:hypothetical protein